MGGKGMESAPDYSRQIVEYVENLNMAKENNEMYVSVFERVYTERGRLNGMLEAKRDDTHKMPFDVITDITGLSEDDLDAIPQRND
jgi:hypothetical protein